MTTMSKMEQEEANSNLQIMHEFLHCLRRQKVEELNEVFPVYQAFRLRAIAGLRNGDIFHSADIISRLSLIEDDELFATAGVSRRIKVVNEQANVQCPMVEMSTQSKLSCVSWNKYTKSHIASSDYEGIVTVWDVTTRQSVMEYEEHEKRAWSLDFSRTNPIMLVSGSDDCMVFDPFTYSSVYLGYVCFIYNG
ncbi:putative transcription factor WD40-like family [Helianthus annuus]|nr:putative transcription factor WD40-like family [Helianthus annuus]